MKYGKTELIRRISDIVRNGWNNNAIRDLIESLWRDPYSHRTSGFVREGGTDARISVNLEVTMVEEVPVYSITFTIAPKERKFDFYQFREILTYHKKYEAESISFEAKEGLHAVYYDFDPVTYEQVLGHWHNPTLQQLRDLYEWMVPITFIYFDADSHQVIYYGDNRHGSWWNPWIHYTLQRTINSMRETGLELTNIEADGDGSLDVHAQFGISAGSCFHGDIRAESSGALPGTDLPVLYFKEGNQPRIYGDGHGSLAVQGLLCFNPAGSIIPANDRWFVMVHVFYTNCIYNPFIAVMGQDQYEKLSTASYLVPSEVAEARAKLPHQYLLHVGTLIYQTSAAFTNRYHSRIVSQAYGVITDMSVTGDGSAVHPVVLVGDQCTPGQQMYYGTDLQGVKGYHPLSGVVDPGSIILQPDHGLEVGVAIRHDGVRYVRALADNDTHAQVCGIVNEILDPDRFRYVVDGFIPSSPQVEWVMGNEYFLSPLVPGEIITLKDPEVWMIGQVRLSLGWGTTRGLKVEIDVGDVVGNYSGSEPFTFDKDFEWCINAGYAESFKLDFSAAYAYSIAGIKAECDGTLSGVSVKCNGQGISGLEDLTIGQAAYFEATANNQVQKDDQVTITSTAAFGGSPTLLRIKLVFTIA